MARNENPWFNSVQLASLRHTLLLGTFKMNSGNKKTIFTYSRKNPIKQKEVSSENRLPNEKATESPIFLKVKRALSSTINPTDSPTSKRHCDSIKAALARADGHLGFLSSHHEKLKAFLNVPQPTQKSNRNELQELLALLRQAEVEDFTAWFAQNNEGKVKKIGEATFSEVFMITDPEDGSGKVMKIIPLSSEFLISAVNEGNDSLKESQEEGDDVLPLPITIPAAIHECKILRRISMLKEHRTVSSPLCWTGFNQLLSLRVVSGAWPRELIRAWSAYTGPRENSSPTRYSPNQLHLIICMQDGGVDLDHFKVGDALQVCSIVCQLACAMALAEEKAAFEHRDLHLGNILISKVAESMYFQFDNVCFPSQGVQCSIIDYSLSRLESAPGGEVMYRDLECLPWLFEGDGQKDAQYQVYKDMRVATSRDWTSFTPKTNILWFSFILQRLLERSGKRPKPMLEALTALKQRSLQYESVSQMIHTDVFFITQLHSNNRPE